MEAETKEKLKTQKTGKLNIFTDKPKSVALEKEVAKVEGGAVPKEKQGKGRPKEHTEDWSKVTVVLFESQIRWLDRLSVDIRSNTRSPLSRAEIIRGVLSAVEESGIDLTKTGSEQAVKELILNLVRGI